jgi:hypothetical protein
MPDPNTHTAAQAAAVTALSCCTRCPDFRISLPTSGAKQARTADLLHAIRRLHVHRSVSVQVTVLPRPCQATAVPASCCTFLLYCCHTSG